MRVATGSATDNCGILAQRERDILHRLTPWSAMDV